MYGLVNKAIQDMVCDRFGEETWKEIKQKAEIAEDIFISVVEKHKGKLKCISEPGQKAEFCIEIPLSID